MDRKNQNGFRSPDAKYTERRKVHAHSEAEEGEMDDSSNALWFATALLNPVSDFIVHYRPTEPYIQRDFVVFL